MRLSQVHEGRQEPQDAADQLNRRKLCVESHKGSLSSVDAMVWRERGPPVDRFRLMSYTPDSGGWCSGEFRMVLSSAVRMMLARRVVRWLAARRRNTSETGGW